MFKQIVVGTDGSDGANIAVDAAIELARLSGATLHVVNAHRVAGATAGARVSPVSRWSISLVPMTRFAVKRSGSVTGRLRVPLRST